MFLEGFFIVIIKVERETLAIIHLLSVFVDTQCVYSSMAFVTRLDKGTMKAISMC